MIASLVLANLEGMFDSGDSNILVDSKIGQKQPAGGLRALAGVGTWEKNDPRTKLNAVAFGRYCSSMGCRQFRLTGVGLPRPLIIRVQI